jgi:bacillolysin
MDGVSAFHHHSDPSHYSQEEGFRDLGARRFETDEAAARVHLDELLTASSEFEDFRGIVAPEDPALVPELRPTDTQGSPVEGNRVVRFLQTHRGVPVFASRVVVELGSERELVSADVKTATLDADPVARLSPADAASVGREISDGGEAPRAPRPVFFGDGKMEHTLAYLVEDVPMSKPEHDEEPPDDVPRVWLDSLGATTMTYVVDARDGHVIFAYPGDHTLDIATLLRGVDDLGRQHDFHGRQANGGFEMEDPDRRVRTHDLSYMDIATSPLPAAVSSQHADWASTNRAAVSAHVNASRVYDFYESVCHRKGIDDKGMTLVSIVNCITAGLSAPPEWINAQWRGSESRMLYGQRKLANGTFQSLATFLDVIAHELTHGVTSHTAGLVYQDETGALSESMSDILGLIINNWYLNGENSDPRSWTWEIGPGLGTGGAPLRDAAQPTLRGCPDHYLDYKTVTYDHGGVHINSGIHTLAAVKLLQSTDPSGALLFTTREVAGFYYSTLQRLTTMATFKQARDAMVTVVSTRYVGFPSEAADAVAAVEGAYDAVGVV